MKLDDLKKVASNILAIEKEIRVERAEIALERANGMKIDEGREEVLDKAYSLLPKMSDYLTFNISYAWINGYRLGDDGGAGLRYYLQNSTGVKHYIDGVTVGNEGVKYMYNMTGNFSISFYRMGDYVVANIRNENTSYNEYKKMYIRKKE